MVRLFPSVLYFVQTIVTWNSAAVANISVISHAASACGAATSTWNITATMSTQLRSGFQHVDRRNVYHCLRSRLENRMARGIPQQASNFVRAFGAAAMPLMLQSTSSFIRDNILFSKIPLALATAPP